MFYDLDDPNRAVQEIKALLARDGVAVIQVSYLYDTIKDMNFYDICNEHLEYYSLHSLKALMERHGLSIFDARTNHVNGGSARVFITHKENNYEESERLKEFYREEIAMDLYNPKTYADFYKKITDLKDIVVNVIKKEISAGSIVLGLGASTKGNVLLQLFGITKEMLPYISERNPDKVGLKTLGTDIELISEEKARKLAKLPKEEALAKVRRLSNKVVYELDLPEVKSLEDITINQLENSIEIKAFAKDKVFHKIIPISLPITNYNLSKGKLVLELDAR